MRSDALIRPDPSPFNERDTTEEHLHLEAAPRSVAAARRFVRASMPRLADETMATVLLLTSELVTNAVLHARTAVHLGIVHDREWLMVAVADGLPVDHDLRPARWSTERLGGRGLALVAELSNQWGTRTHGSGKTVWFILPLTADQSMRLR